MLFLILLVYVLDQNLLIQFFMLITDIKIVIHPHFYLLIGKLILGIQENQIILKNEFYVLRVTGKDIK